MDKVYTTASFSQHYEELERDESGAFGKVFKVSKLSLAHICKFQFNLLMCFRTTRQRKPLKLLGRILCLVI